MDGADTGRTRPGQRSLDEADALSASAVTIYWLPMGARGRWLHLAGRAFEGVCAMLEGRGALDIYHSVLEVRLEGDRFVIEMGPAIDDRGRRRGVVAVGPVATSWAGVIRPLRYEVRCWRGGLTAFDFAVDSPRRLSRDEQVAARVLAFVHDVPTPVWGRDDLGTGEMWTCNSLTSWLLARGGLDGSVRPPKGGRAPGWDAGLVVGRRGMGI